VSVLILKKHPLPAMMTAIVQQASSVNSRPNALVFLVAILLIVSLVVTRIVVNWPIVFMLGKISNVSVYLEEFLPIVKNLTVHLPAQRGKSVLKKKELLNVNVFIHHVLL